jgi:response regulator of citrate/malate metabolism
VRHRQDDPSAGAPDAAVLARAELPAGSRCTVLIVEDDPVTARIHHRYVSGIRGFTVVGIAPSGDHAGQMLRTLRPDVVLLDLNLPQSNGLTLLSAMRREAHAAEVIVVSAHASPRLVRRCLQLGVLDYLVKPFWVSRLADALSLVTARAEAFREGPSLSQGCIDRVRGQAEPADGKVLGITPAHLARVRQVVAAAAAPVSAGQVSQAVGMSRVTARRYLEHLVYLGQCAVDTECSDRPGRPTKVYRPWLSTPVGGAHRGQ